MHVFIRSVTNVFSKLSKLTVIGSKTWFDCEPRLYHATVHQKLVAPSPTIRRLLLSAMNKYLSMPSTIPDGQRRVIGGYNDVSAAFVCSSDWVNWKS